MKMITAILIDDERKSLSSLKNKIERLCPTVSIIGESECPKKGLELILTLNPQLIFLYVAMPELNGFAFLNEVKLPNFEVIFITAFDHFEVEPINHSAIGYLLNPVVSKDLVLAVNNAIQNIEHKTALKRNQTLIENLSPNFSQRKVSIPTREGLEFILISEIIHLKGTEGYTKISFLNQKPILSSYSIGYFHELLINQDFHLVHKSHLINAFYIRAYLNEGYVLLTNNRKIPVARSRRSKFLNKLQER